MGERLEGKVKELIKSRNLLSPGDRVVVGVSGGPDSMGLLYLLHQLSSELRLKLVVANLHHGFRKEADREVLLVRNTSRQWNLPYYGARVDVPVLQEKTGLSSQEAARWARYHFFLKAARYFKASKIAVAHHRDDQVETVLLHLLHGSGLDGLTGMRLYRTWKGTQIIRPLLEVSHREIEQYCSLMEVPYLVDTSNLKGVYRRNRVRRELLPFLKEEFNPNIKDALHRMSRLLSEERDYMEKVAISSLSSLAKLEKGKIFLDSGKFKDTPLPVQRRIIRKAYNMVIKPGANLDALHVDQLIQLGTGSKTGKELSLPGKGYAYKVSDGFYLERYREECDFAPVKLNIPGWTYLLPLGFKIKSWIQRKEKLPWPPRHNQVYLDYHKLDPPLYFRIREPGDRLKPLGFPHRKKLKDFFIDLKVPAPKRERSPLLISGKKIAWVVGYRISHDFRITRETTKVLVLQIDRPISLEG